MREGLRSALRFAAAPAWDGYVISSVGVNISSTDAELDEYILNNAGTVDHVAGTASMSRKGAPYGVVDPDLRVKGLTGLRIVDLSVVVCFVFCLQFILMRSYTYSRSSPQATHKPQRISSPRELPILLRRPGISSVSKPRTYHVK
jgi:hypothetical protein